MTNPTETKRRWQIGVGAWMNQHFGTQVILGALEYANRARFAEVRVLDATQLNPKNPQDLASMDGLIAVLDWNEIWRIEALPIHKVLVPRFSSDLNMPFVTTDAKSQGALAAEHLLGLGLQHVGVLSEHSILVQGFREVAERAGAQFIEPEPPRPWSTPEGMVAINAWIRRLPHPCGIATQINPDFLLKTIIQAGRRVPEDIALMGILDDPISSLRLQPTLTCIAVDTDRIGWLAAEMLERLCRGETVPPVSVPPKGVIRRQSTDTDHSLADNMVAAAIKYIHQHMGEMIDGTIIADHLGVPRTTLHWRFTREMGHSIHEEIKRYRLERATHMLANTTATLKEISYAIGIPVAPNFNRFIKQQTGLSPRRYREKHQKARPTN